MVYGTGLRVVDENMADVPKDTETMGEVVMQGDAVMKGYYDDPDATAEAFRGGWFHSGDLAVWHPDGYIELQDRSKDIIISGGENISSQEVEKVIMEHPAVLEVCVVGVPDDRWGEVPKAFVDRRRNHQFHPRPHRPLQGAQERRVRRSAQNCHRQDSKVHPAGP